MTIKQTNKTTKEELELCGKIAERASSMANKYAQEYKQSTAFMDIELTHSNNPIDLERLLNADDVNFAHDVFGIRNHLNRSTGELMDCFSPRHSK